ncbi:MAG: FtsX-like permease family protein, partial [Oscillospiraceae bacterium]|nr:FtsX-like permease family protein [Oscillospiraceae bacterium]
YTDIYLTVNGSAGMDSYSKEYTGMVSDVMDIISDTLKDSQIAQRYDSLTGEAYAKIADAESELNEKVLDAEKEIADAELEILDGYEKIRDGEQDIKDGWNELYANRKKLDDAEKDIAEGESELADARRKLEDGKKEYDSGAKRLKQEQQKIDKLSSGVTAIPSMIEAMSYMLPTPADEETYISLMNNVVAASTGAAELMKMGGSDGEFAAANIEAINTNALQAMHGKYFELSYDIISNLSSYQDAMEGTIAAAQKELSDASNLLKKSKKELDDGYAALAEGVAKLADAKAEVADGRKKLNDGIRKLQDAELELEEARIELQDGERELEENKLEFEIKTADARALIDEAKTKVLDIPYPKWYILDRTSVDSFVRLDNDVSSIQAVCSVFPVIFLIVAVSVCLSSMTRLVEEERSIIGTLKALGYSNTVITLKYVIFAFIACIVGGILGGILGSSYFPDALWSILMILHKFPNFTLQRNFSYVVYGSTIYIVALAAATIYSCIRSLRSKPSELLRQKAPSKGARVLIERIKFIWSNLKFLGKITARNLFRYKKRMFMTIFGVCTCTALIVTGFALKNSAKNLVPKQFDTVATYDMIVIFDDDEATTQYEIESYLKNDDRVSDYLVSHLGEITVINETGDSIGLQLITLDNMKDYSDFFRLTGEHQSTEIELSDEVVLITENAAKILEVSHSDSIILRDSDNEEYSVVLGEIVHSYIGNSVYISSEHYTHLFGELSYNAYFVHIDEGTVGSDRRAFRRELLDIKHILSVVLVDSIRNGFDDSIQVVDSVVLLLIGFATCLAFVVLYTLANINISERKHEMATLKVLGFYNREIYQYVNRETIVLALFGILFGLPAGYGIAQFIVATIRMPSISIHVDIMPISYVAATAITFTFTLITNLFTNTVLKKLDMIESLKNME